MGRPHACFLPQREARVGEQEVPRGPFDRSVPVLALRPIRAALDSRSGAGRGDATGARWGGGTMSVSGSRCGESTGGRVPARLLGSVSVAVLVLAAAAGCGGNKPAYEPGRQGVVSVE